MHSSLRLINSLVFFLLCLLLVWEDSCHALNFNANWDYQQSGGEDIETRDRFLQRYSLGVGPSLSYRPTHAISASANLSYTRSEAGDDRRIAGQDELTPSAQISLRNDIFLAQLAGSTTINTSDHGQDNRRSSWNAALGTNSNIPLWPKIRLNYGERSEFFESTSLSSEADRNTKDASVSVDWDLSVAEFYYRYNHSETEQRERTSRLISDSHFARFETSGNFWNNRFSFNYSQQVRFTSRSVEDDEAAGGFDVFLPGGTSAAITDPVVLPDPLPLDPWTDDEIGLLPAPVLSNDELDDPITGLDDFTSSAVVIEDGERGHLVFVGIERGIDALRIYLHPTTVLTEEQVQNLSWDLYQRDPAGTGWEIFSENVVATYNPLENFLSLPVDSLDREIMAVLINDTGVSLPFTELAAIGTFFQEAGGDDSTNYLTNLGINYRITDSLSLSGNLILDHFSRTNSDNDRRTVSAGLRWSPSPFVAPSIGFSEQREEQTGEEDTLNRTYSLTIPTYPLPTMNLSFGVTYTERFEGELKTDMSKRYSISSNAQIYPDLTALWFLAYLESDRFDEEGPVSSTQSFSARLDLQSRLRRDLTADLITNYNHTESDVTDVQTIDSKLSLRYRPSELLALRGSYTKAFGDFAREDILELGMNLRLLLTHKTRLTLNVAHRQQDESRQTIGLLGDWEISRNFFLQGRGSYFLAERNSYNFGLNLSFRL